MDEPTFCVLCGTNGRRNALIFMGTFNLGVAAYVFMCPWCDRTHPAKEMH